MRIFYSYGAICRPDFAYLSGVVDTYENEDICHAVLFEFRSGRWSHWVAETRIVGLSALDVQDSALVIAVGFDGNIQVKSAAGVVWESIGDGPEMPSNLRQLTCSRVIDGYLYVAGMSRQVLRRPVFGGAWERADHGALVPLSSPEINGFLALDGRATDLYACGYFGHLWHAIDGVWRQVELTTNMNLTGVCYFDQGRIYVGGSRGVLFRGNGNRWAMIDHQATENTFTTIVQFQNRVFALTDRGGIYEILGDMLRRISMEEDFFCGYLAVSANVMLAVGPMRSVLFDGKVWSPLPLPT